MTVEFTDPAHEFATLCRELRGPAPETGADYLANQFGTQPYTAEFYQIFFAIVERGNDLRKLTTQIPEAAHIAAQIDENISQILVAFNASYLGGSWKNHGSPNLQENNVAPIFILSAVIRNHVSYPLLGDVERDEVLACVNELLGWLEEHQLNDQDFIRQALIDGLRQFAFRMQRLKWLGWGYTIQSLRDVISAYMALERSFTNETEMPVVAITLKKVGEALKTIYTTVGVAKDVVERADFLLKAYGAASAYMHVKAGGIAGLLTFAGSVS